MIVMVFVFIFNIVVVFFCEMKSGNSLKWTSHVHVQLYVVLYNIQLIVLSQQLTTEHNKVL